MEKDYKLKSGNILRVIADPMPSIPDEDNDDVFLVYDHKQFTVKRKGFEPKDIDKYLRMNVKNSLTIENHTYDDYYIFPVDAYIHSGVHLSLANTKNYPDRRWDVSTAGYILVRKDYTIHLSCLNCNKDDCECRAKEALKDLLELWNQYLSDDIWGFQILKPIKTYIITEENLDKLLKNYHITYSDIIYNSEQNVEYKEIDSCWGFYGSNPRENGMLDSINDEILE